MNIESTCTQSCLVTASHILPDPGHRSALWLMIGLTRMWSGCSTFLTILLSLVTRRMEIAKIAAAVWFWVGRKATETDRFGCDCEPQRQGAYMEGSHPATHRPLWTL